MDGKAFYKKYRLLCEEHGMTRRSCALKIGVSPASVTKWSHGAVPDTATIHKVAQFFGLTINELLDYGAAPDQIPLSDEARQLVLCYNRMSDEDKKIINIIVEKYKK